MKRKATFNGAFFLTACLFLFVPAYMDYEVLAESDCLSATAKYENLDFEDLPIEKQVNVIAASSPVPILLPLLEDRNLAPATSCLLGSFPDNSMNLRC